jgi:hypothetical protein
MRKEHFLIHSKPSVTFIPKQSHHKKNKNNNKHPEPNISFVNIEAKILKKTLAIKSDKT